MDACGLSGRGAQSELMRRTGWSKATTSQLVSGKQGYNPEIIEQASLALSIEPHELLMHPDKAMAIRQLRASAAQIMNVVDPAPTKDERKSA